MRHIRAKSIYPGRIRGVMAEYRRERFALADRPATSPRLEFRHFKSALRAAQLQLAGEKKMMLDRRRKIPGEMQAIDDAIDVLESHIMTLEDPYFLGEIKNRIFNTGATGAAALGAVIGMVSRQFAFDSPPSRLSESPQNRHFIKDMNDIRRRILFFLGLQQELSLPEGVSIIAAPKLTVSEVLALKRAGVRGIIIGETSETAHELVMLRAMRIPCVSVADAKFFRIRKNPPVILDADIGYIVLNPRRSARFTQSPGDDALPQWSTSVRLRSGQVARLSGTLHFTSELQERPPGASRQGIGLYRTEYQVSEAGELPHTRQLGKQYEYLLSRRDLEITFRLFDFSEDKNFLQSRLIEANRDMRGIRFLLHEKKIIESQLTALLRAAHEADREIRILIPYLTEWRELKAVTDLIAEHNPGKRKVRVVTGAMLESAGSVFSARRWLGLTDFLYVGTSDLLSSIAMERREHTDAIHRALLSDAFQALARELIFLKKKQPVILCGEICGEPWAIAWLTSLGFSDFVVPTHRIPVIANLLQSVTVQQCRQFAKKVTRINDETERLEAAKALALDMLYGGI